MNQLTRELETLSGFSDAQAPAVTRIVFSPTDMRARAWLKTLYSEVGLAVREDAIGNTFARWQGAEPELPPVVTGSHIDAIPESGAYDGTVGVMGALEAIRSLQRAGFRPRRPIELLMFTSEEPTRFGIGCLGSRMLCGSLNAASREKLRDSQGRSVDQVRSEAGFHGDLDAVRLPPGYFSAFVELHIEQGPILESSALPIGLVTHIAAPATLSISIEGQGGHAGAVLMPQRRDAFLAACEIALAAEHAAKSSGSPDTVATTGSCEIYPGAVNSIPSRVRLLADIRDIDPTRRDGVLDAVRQRCDATAAARGVSIQIDVLNQDLPAECDPLVLGAVRQACEELGIQPLPLISRAYHDSLFMSRIGPAAMIFIPCRGGVSHRPDEYSSPEQIETGVQVLAGTLARLAS